MQMQATARPREGKRVGDAVWFDLSLGLPLGLGLSDAAGGRVVVDAVREGGSAAEHNEKHMLADGTFNRQHWIQPGDQLLMVNNARCGSTAEAVELITGAEDTEHLRLKFVRKCLGNVKVLFPESQAEVSVPFEASVAQAAQVAGHPVEYRCTDGTCGSCWQQDERTEEVYLLCQEDCTVGRVPSQTMFSEESIFWNEREARERQALTPNFDNSEPLILRSCPEVYEGWKKKDWQQGLMAEARESRFSAEWMSDKLKQAGENLGGS